MLHRLFTNNWVILGGSVLLATLAILRAFPKHRVQLQNLSLPKRSF